MFRITGEGLFPSFEFGDGVCLGWDPNEHFTQNQVYIPRGNTGRVCAGQEHESRERTCLSMIT